MTGGHDVERLRKQIARCRRLAAHINDEHASGKLEALAKDYEKKVASLEAVRTEKGR